MIKITGGSFKNTKLETISKFVRPTSAIKREAFFSIINSYAIKNSYNFSKNKIFLDLFAGIGTMGLEAISRGVGNVIFYENNKIVMETLKKNCKKICDKEQYKIFEEDILNASIDLDFDNISIVYIDPPYHKYNLYNLLLNLQNKINQKTIIGIESSIEDTLIIPKNLKIIIKKKYGKTNLSFLVLS